MKHSYFMFYEFDCLYFSNISVYQANVSKLPCSYVFLLLFVVGVQYSIISVT